MLQLYYDSSYRPWALPRAGRNASLTKILQPSARNEAIANSRRMRQ